MYDVNKDGEVYSEKEILDVLSIHYRFYMNLPWFMKLYYKPWIVLLDSLATSLAPNCVAHINESASVLDEVNDILGEIPDEDSNS